MLDRSIAPPFANLEGIDLTRPEIHRLDRNWKACILHDGRYPVIVMELIFANGRWWEKATGCAHFAAKMLQEGTTKYRSTEISKAFARYGSYLEILPGLDFVNVRLHTLKKHFRPCAELLFHLLQDAAFPEPEFETLKQIRKANIKNQLARNSQLANAKFAESLFGAAHPYGQIITPELIEGCDLDQVRSEYEQGFFNRPKLILAGDVDAEVEWLQTQLQSLPMPELLVDPAPIALTSQKEQINKGGTQASIRMGGHTIGRTDENIFHLTVANRLLGGFFGSRLMKNIREDKGLTYGIYSHIVHFAHASYWVIGSEVSIQDIDVATEEAMSEIKKLGSVPPTQEEMTLLRNYSTGKMLGDIDSPLSLISIYKPQFLLDLSLDYHDRYLKALDEVTPEEISQAISNYFEIEKSTTVVVA
ncbi:MAG: pitrilysin family protein [Bacteroidota bacterium]